MGRPFLDTLNPFQSASISCCWTCDTFPTAPPLPALPSNFGPTSCGSPFGLSDAFHSSVDDFGLVHHPGRCKDVEGSLNRPRTTYLQLTHWPPHETCSKIPQYSRDESFTATLFASKHTPLSRAGVFAKRGGVRASRFEQRIALAASQTLKPKSFVESKATVTRGRKPHFMSH